MSQIIQACKYVHQTFMVFLSVFLAERNSIPTERNERVVRAGSVRFGLEIIICE